MPLQDFYHKVYSLGRRGGETAQHTRCGVREIGGGVHSIKLCGGRDGIGLGAAFRTARTGDGDVKQLAVSRRGAVVLAGWGVAGLVYAVIEPIKKIRR